MESHGKPLNGVCVQLHQQRATFPRVWDVTRSFSLGKHFDSVKCVFGKYARYQCVSRAVEKNNIAIMPQIVVEHIDTY
jgi:hypothetical protein